MVSLVSQLPLVQNSISAKVAYFGVAYLIPFTIKHKLSNMKCRVLPYLDDQGSVAQITKEYRPMSELK